MKKKRFFLPVIAAMILLTGCGNQTVEQAINADKGQAETDAGESVKNSKHVKKDTQKEKDTELSDTEDAETTEKEDVYFEVKSLSDSNDQKENQTEIFVSSYQYYTITGGKGDQAVIDKVNQALDDDLSKAKESADSTLADAKSGYTDYQAYQETLPKEERQKFRPYALYYQSSIVRNDEQVFSICVRTDVNLQGAHGDYSYHCLNFDVQTGEVIGWDDLSDDTEQFEANVISLVQDISKSADYADRFYDVDTTDFSSAILQDGTFALTEEGMEIVIDPYIFGPYASGAFSFRLKADQLAGIKEQYNFKKI